MTGQAKSFRLLKHLARPINLFVVGTTLSSTSVFDLLSITGTLDYIASFWRHDSSFAVSSSISCFNDEKIWVSHPAYRALQVLYSEAAAIDLPAIKPAAPAGPSLKSIAKNEIVANLFGVPVELMWKDLWNVLFHKEGRQFWVDMKFWLKGQLFYTDPHKAAVGITWELQNYLYDDRTEVNQGAWRAIQRKVEEHLREWWLQFPEDPWSGLTTGAWKSLIKVYVEVLEPALRGSGRLKKLDDLLFDQHLTIIRSWTDPQHVAIMKGNEADIQEKLESLHRRRMREGTSTEELRSRKHRRGLSNFRASQEKKHTERRVSFAAPEEAERFEEEKSLKWRSAASTQRKT